MTRDRNCIFSHGQMSRNSWRTQATTLMPLMPIMCRTILYGTLLTLGLGATACRLLPPLPARQHILRIHASNPGSHQLCIREAKDGDEDKDSQDSDCQPFAGQYLDAPGTFTVVIDGAQPGDSFSLSVDQFKTEASHTAVKELVAKFRERFNSVQSNLTGAEAREVTDTSSDPDGSSQAAAGESDTDSSSGGRQEARPSSAEIFGPHLHPALDGQQRPVNKLMTPTEWKDKVKQETPDTWPTNPTGWLAFNEPSTPLPPPRSFAISQSDINYLQGKGLDVAAVRQHIVDWCSIDGFQSPENWNIDWQEAYDTAKLKSHWEDPKKLLDQFNITIEVLTAVLNETLTQKAAFSAYRRSTIQVQAGNYARMPDLEKALFLAYLAPALAQRVDNCLKNVKFALAPITPAGEASPVEPEEEIKGTLSLAQSGLETLRAALRAPLAMHTELANRLETARQRTKPPASAEGFAFKTISLQPGRLLIGVSKKSAETETQLASLDVPVRGTEWLHVTAGPVVFGCLWCHRFVENTEPVTTDREGRPTATTTRRVINKRPTHFDASLAIGLHVSLPRLRRRSFAGGIFLGSPLSEPTGTSHNVLAGIGLRIRPYIELAAGAHLFRARRLVRGVTTPIDLSLPGNEAVTVDMVTTERYNASIFLYVGISQELF